MKKLLFTVVMIFAALFYACTALAQGESLKFVSEGTLAVTGEEGLTLQQIFKTPSGISYYKFGNGSDVVIYMDGYSSNPQPLQSSFYKSFHPSISTKVTCYIPIPLANSGWEKPWNGTWIGIDFLKFVVSENNGKRIFVTGYSAGGDPGYIYAVDGITAFASVAGSDTNWNGMMGWRGKLIPVWAFIGTSDTSENSRANCEKTWISWFYGTDHLGNLRNGAPTYVNGGHGSVDDYAYNPANGLWAWFDSIGKPTEPLPVPIDDQGKSWYYSESEKVIIFETQNGKKLRVLPD